MIFVESNHIEYKRELSDSLEKEVVAFLNSKEGGVIYIGIDSKAQKITGVSDADEIQLKIKDRIKQNIAPSVMGLFDVLLERQENKDIIKINIASGSEKPYHLKKLGMSEKGCFIRVGSASEPMPARLIEDVFAKRARNSIRLIRSPKKELSFEQLKIYYQEAGFSLNDKFATNLELLNPDGSGIPRILKKYDPSIFLFTENFLRVTFMFGEYIPQTEVDSGLVEGLVENQRRMLQVLKVYPFSSKQELAEQLKISTTAVDKNIKALKGKGLLRRIGPDKGGHWEVLVNEKNFRQKPNDAKGQE